MIKFDLAIRDPWAHDLKRSWSKDWDCRLWGHKNFEIQLAQMSAYSVFRLLFDLSWRGEDHAGPEFELDVLGFLFRMKVYDDRHWDWDKGTWEKNDNYEDASQD